MTLEEMQNELLHLANEMNQRLVALEESERERQERYDKLNAEDRAQRQEEYRKHEQRSEETLALHRRSTDSMEALATAMREWMATR